MTCENTKSNRTISALLFQSISAANAARTEHVVVKNTFRAAEARAKESLKIYEQADARFAKAGSAERKQRTNATIKESNDAFYRFAEARDEKNTAHTEKELASRALRESKFRLRESLSREVLALQIRKHADLFLFETITDEMVKTLKKGGIAAIFPMLFEAAKEEHDMFEGLLVRDEDDAEPEDWSNFEVELTTDRETALRKEAFNCGAVEYFSGTNLLTLIVPGEVYEQLLEEELTRESIGVPTKDSDEPMFDALLVSERAFQLLKKHATMHIEKLN